jgi:hypothetical protein
LNFTRIVAVVPIAFGAVGVNGEAPGSAEGDGFGDAASLDEIGLVDATAPVDGDALDDGAALADGDGSAARETAWCPTTAAIAMLENAMSATRRVRA